MSTVKDKMIEALAIYVADVRDGRDNMASDEDVAATAFDVMATAADQYMDAPEFRALTDLLFAEVEEYVSVEEAFRPLNDPVDNAALLRRASEILAQVAESL